MTVISGGLYYKQDTVGKRERASVIEWNAARIIVVNVAVDLIFFNTDLYY